MNRPRPLTRVLGTSVVTFGVLAIGCMVLFQWWGGDIDNDIMPAVAVLVMISAANANQKLTDYKNWKRAWDTLGSVSIPRQRHVLSRHLLGIILWLVIGLALTEVDLRHTSSWIAIDCYLLATVLLSVGLVLHYCKRFGSGQVWTRKPFVVAVRLRVPRRSPDARQFAQRLPDYCIRLLHRSADKEAGTSWPTIRAP